MAESGTSMQTTLEPTLETATAAMLKTAVEDRLWRVEQVVEYTGWSRQYISKLCSQGILPHIPCKPFKFIPSEVKKAIAGLQTGGEYGKRKSKLKTKKV